MRPAPPPFAPDYGLVVCRACGRRMFDDDGADIHGGWLFWLCWLIPPRRR